MDLKFDFYSDSNGRDPDFYSDTLKSYHCVLWSKELPNGDHFNVQPLKGYPYLVGRDSQNTISLGSDAISHSYRDQKRKSNIVSQVPVEVGELFSMGSTICGYTLFPNRQVNRKNTINQARGVNSLIDDRFDLTLECIRRYYISEPSPLTDCFNRYSSFFELFTDFRGYVEFFLLEDLIDEKGRVKYYLLFDDFRTRPGFKSVYQYLLYKENVCEFLSNRRERIGTYVAGLND